MYAVVSLKILLARCGLRLPRNLRPSREQPELTELEGVLWRPVGCVPWSGLALVVVFCVLAWGRLCGGPLFAFGAICVKWGEFLTDTIARRLACRLRVSRCPQTLPTQLVAKSQ